MNENASSEINSCSMLQVADAESADTGLPVGAVAYQAAGPSTGTFSVEPNSSTAGTNWIETTTMYSDPATYSVAAWFKMNAITSGGTLFQLANLQEGTPAGYDRILWVDDSGHIVWGSNYQGTGEEQKSTTTVAANAWYYVVLSFTSGGNVTGYLDGAQIFTSASTPNSTPDSYAGYWRLGYGYYSTSTWADSPVDAYFDGYLAGLTFYGAKALSAANDTNLYDAGNFAQYSANLAAVGTPTDYWGMQDTGSTGYSSTGLPSGGVIPDQTLNANTGTIAGGVTLATGVSPIGGGDVYELNGSTGNVQTSTLETNPQVYTQSAWFELPSGDSGTIFGFSDVQGTTGLTYWDRAIWVDQTGHLVAAVWPPVKGVGTIEEIVSPGTYDNGAWHDVTVTLGPAGFFMYADGVLVASNTGVTAAWTYNGYWHLGWSGNELTAWTDPPKSTFFPGDIAGAAVFSAQLSAAQSDTLGTSGTYDAQVFTDGVTNFWNWFTPSVCGLVTLATTVTSSGACVLPATGCSTPLPLSSLVGASSASVALTPIGSTSSTGWTETTAASTGPPFENGLVAFGQETLSGEYRSSGWTVALQHPYEIALG